MQPKIQPVDTNWDMFAKHKLEVLALNEVRMFRPPITVKCAQLDPTAFYKIGIDFVRPNTKWYGYDAAKEVWLHKKNPPPSEIEDYDNLKWHESGIQTGEHLMNTVITFEKLWSSMKEIPDTPQRQHIRFQRNFEYIPTIKLFRVVDVKSGKTSPDAELSLLPLSFIVTSKYHCEQMIALKAEAEGKKPRQKRKNNATNSPTSSTDSNEASTSDTIANKAPVKEESSNQLPQSVLDLSNFAFPSINFGNQEYLNNQMPQGCPVNTDLLSPFNFPSNGAQNVAALYNQLQQMTHCLISGGGIDRKPPSIRRRLHPLLLVVHPVRYCCLCPPVPTVRRHPSPIIAIMAQAGEGIRISLVEPGWNMFRKLVERTVQSDYLFKPTIFFKIHNLNPHERYVVTINFRRLTADKKDYNFKTRKWEPEETAAMDTVQYDNQWKMHISGVQLGRYFTNKVLKFGDIWVAAKDSKRGKYFLLQHGFEYCPVIRVNRVSDADEKVHVFIHEHAVYETRFFAVPKKKKNPNPSAVGLGLPHQRHNLPPSAPVMNNPGIPSMPLSSEQFRNWIMALNTNAHLSQPQHSSNAAIGNNSTPAPSNAMADVAATISQFQAALASNMGANGWNGLPQQSLDYNQPQRFPAVNNVNVPLASTWSDQQRFLAHMAPLVPQFPGAPPSSNIAASTGTSNASSSQSQPQVPSTSNSVGTDASLSTSIASKAPASTNPPAIFVTSIPKLPVASTSSTVANGRPQAQEQHATEQNNVQPALSVTNVNQPEDWQIYMDNILPPPRPQKSSTAKPSKPPSSTSKARKAPARRRGSSQRPQDAPASSNVAVSPVPPTPCPEVASTSRSIVNGSEAKHDRANSENQENLNNQPSPSWEAIANLKNFVNHLIDQNMHRRI